MWNLCTTGWPWVDAYVLFNIPTPDLNLSAIALHNNITFHRQEWIIKDENENQQITSSKGTTEDTISIGCQIENHVKCMTTTLHIVVNHFLLIPSTEIL